MAAEAAAYRAANAAETEAGLGTETDAPAPTAAPAVEAVTRARNANADATPGDIANTGGVAGTTGSPDAGTPD